MGRGGGRGPKSRPCGLPSFLTLPTRMQGSRLGPWGQGHSLVLRGPQAPPGGQATFSLSGVCQSSSPSFASRSDTHNHATPPAPLLPECPSSPGSQTVSLSLQPLPPSFSCSPSRQLQSPHEAQPRPFLRAHTSPFGAISIWGLSFHISGEDSRVEFPASPSLLLEPRIPPPPPTPPAPNQEAAAPGPRRSLTPVSCLTPNSARPGSAHIPFLLLPEGLCLPPSAVCS